MAQIRIVDGPSRWDLMLSLLDGDYLHRREVYFRLGKEGSALKLRLAVVINLLEREDGTGEKWLFQGNISGMNPFSRDERRVKGYIDLTTRSGWLEQIAD